MDLRPMSGWLVIEPDTAKEVSDGGVIIPDSVYKEAPLTGTVMRVGNGRMLDSGIIEQPDVAIG